MRDLDETDLEILRLLAADGRRPFSEIADAVGLSPPAVSDRVTRLEEAEVIRRFTVDIDRSKLRDGTPVLFDLRVDPTEVDAVRAALVDAEAVEHVFTTANARLLVNAHLPAADPRLWLLERVDADLLREYDVELLSHADWTVSSVGTEFALTCAECDNSVTSEGVTTRVDGDLKHFCCRSCEARFVERYEQLREAAES